MIDPTKKRLTKIFISVIIILNILIFSISYAFLHQTIINRAKSHMHDDIEKEFLDQFYRSGLDTFQNMWNEHHFQILNKDGVIVVSTRNSFSFYPSVNQLFLKNAFSGHRGYEIQQVDNDSYLISYFLLDGTYVGRSALSLTEEKKYEHNFLKLILITLPGMLILSYFISRYLVNHTMEQISDFFTFQTTFSSNVTHELRSPLASLKGNIEVALRRERSIDEYRDVLNLSLKEVDRIINLLNNLYLLASSKFKPLDLFKNRVDIKQVINEVVRLYAPVIKSKKINFDISELSSISCFCDEGLIRRTFENLLDNAVKYTPESGSINLSVSKDLKNLMITITNTCQLLDREETKYIFAPFYRAKNTMNLNSEGKGLGLYISRYIVRSHGGDISINNTYGKLFSLTVYLPIQ